MTSLSWTDLIWLPILIGLVSLTRVTWDLWRKK